MHSNEPINQTLNKFKLALQEGNSPYIKTVLSSPILRKKIKIFCSTMTANPINGVSISQIILYPNALENIKYIYGEHLNKIVYDQTSINSKTSVSKLLPPSISDINLAIIRASVSTNSLSLLTFILSKNTQEMEESFTVSSKNQYILDSLSHTLKIAIKRSCDKCFIHLCEHLGESLWANNQSRLQALFNYAIEINSTLSAYILFNLDKDNKYNLLANYKNYYSATIDKFKKDDEQLSRIEKQIKDLSDEKIIISLKIEIKKIIKENISNKNLENNKKLKSSKI